MSDAPRVPDDAATDLAEPIIDDEQQPEDPEFVVDEEEPPEPPPEDDGEPVAPQQGRAQTRIQRLERERDEARQQAAELRGYRQALEQRQTAPVADPYAQQRQLEQLAQRWAEMDMNGQHAQARQEQLQVFQQQLQNNAVNQQIAFREELDRNSYEAKASVSATHQRYAQEVEREVAAMRARGILDIKRQDVLERLVGRDALARAAKAAPGQRRAAASRVASQQTRPAGARSDGARTGGRPQPGSAEDDERIIAEGFAAGLRI